MRARKTASPVKMGANPDNSLPRARSQNRAMPFVHLHCHTDYSLLVGACELVLLMQIVSEQKMSAVSMTDHGNLFGAVQFYNAAKNSGIHPVIGCEVHV